MVISAWKRADLSLLKIHNTKGDFKIWNLIGIALIWFSDTALYLFRVTSTRAVMILFSAGFEIGIGIKYIQLPFIWDIKFFEYIVLS